MVILKQGMTWLLRRNTKQSFTCALDLGLLTGIFKGGRLGLCLSYLLLYLQMLKWFLVHKTVILFTG